MLNSLLKAAPIVYVPGHEEAVTALVIVVCVLAVINIAALLAVTYKYVPAVRKVIEPIYAKIKSLFEKKEAVPVAEAAPVEAAPVETASVEVAATAAPVAVDPEEEEDERLAFEAAKGWADGNGVVLEGVNDVPVVPDEGLSLRHSFEISKKLVGDKSIHKKSIITFLTETFKEEVEVNGRENFTSTGLPLADTHYTLMKMVDGNREKAGKKCFTYVYESASGSVLVLVKIPESYANTLKGDHVHVHKSAFPKTRDGATWFSIPVDETWSAEQLYKVLADAKAFNEDPNYVPTEGIVIVEEAWVKEHREYLEKNELNVEEDENGEYVIGVFFKQHKQKIYWFKYDGVDFARGEVAQYHAIEGDMRKVVVAIPKIRKDMSGSTHELKTLVKRN